VVEATLSLGDGTRLTGAPGLQTTAVGPLPVLFAGDLALSDVWEGDAQKCTPGTLNASKVAQAGSVIIVSLHRQLEA
jgi:hypothetical protein